MLPIAKMQTQQQVTEVTISVFIFLTDVTPRYL